MLKCIADPNVVVNMPGQNVSQCYISTEQSEAHQTCSHGIRVSNQLQHMSSEALSKGFYQIDLKNCCLGLLRMYIF